MPNTVSRDAYILSDIGRFSQHVLRMPLYAYQRRPLNAILGSIVNQRGHEHLLVFSRQSGKNEAVAHLLVYLLNLYQRQGGNIVYAAIGDALGRGRRRLLERLNNPWNRRQWRLTTRPSSVQLGRSAVIFISSHPQSYARGETAGRLLVIDELQDQDPLYLESVFTPMRAATNATAVYLGTVRSRHDALWLKKEQLERLQNFDGIRRVFWAGPDQVTAANPRYAAFLGAQVARHGRYHPIIASEYYLEPLESGGGLFPPRRLKLMRGTHPRRRTPHQEAQPAVTSHAHQSIPHRVARPARSRGVRSTTTPSPPRPSAPTHPRRRTPHQEAQPAITSHAHQSIPHRVARPARSSGVRSTTTPSPPRPSPPATIALLDVGGQDEAATETLAQLANPARDYTACTIVQVIHSETDDQPTYHAIDIFTDQGSRHFDNANEGGALADRLLAYLQTWQIRHLIADAAGVGEGLVDWLAARLGRGRVTPFKFTRTSKAALGAAFLTLVETGRFQYWAGDADHIGSDGWWYWQQAARCIYELPPGGLLEKHLRWYVPPSARVSTPQGLRPVHDDRLISAALVAEADRLLREGKLNLGHAESAITPPYDPLTDLPDW